jgi:hypothetical protein
MLIWFLRRIRREERHTCKVGLGFGNKGLSGKSRHIDLYFCLLVVFKVEYLVGGFGEGDIKSENEWSHECLYIPVLTSQEVDTFLSMMFGD